MQIKLESGRYIELSDCKKCGASPEIRVWAASPTAFIICTNPDCDIGTYDYTRDKEEWSVIAAIRAWNRGGDT